MTFTWKKAAAFAAMAALTVSFAGCGGGDKKAEEKKPAEVKTEKATDAAPAKKPAEEKKAAMQALMEEGLSVAALPGSGWPQACTHKS